MICISIGILKIKHLRKFITATDPSDTSQFSRVIGWGNKHSSRRAISLAAILNRTYCALEDGFLRSIGLGVDGVQPLSLVVDEVGIYYDARKPSRLEQLITANADITKEAESRSRRCISAIREYRLSKYNQNQSDPQLRAAAPKIVVIDQTQGDASVEGAMANQETFIDMLRCAVESHPNETVWVKVHPDVVHGQKKGFLYPLPFEHPNVKLYAEPVNPWDFLETSTHVYTVSSLMGFEALMAGAQVHCFGMPFYAGWGLTYDQQRCERRNKSRTLEQIFDAAYIQYARYVDPILGERCEIEQIISYLSDQIAWQANAKTKVCLSSLSWWKRLWLDDYMRAWGFKLSASGSSIRWGRGEPDEEGFCIEDGFIRSVGLGVHFNRPVSLVCDRRGIYFDARVESDLEYALNHTKCSDWGQWRAQELITRLLSANLTKYNVGTDTVLDLPVGRKVILVPGQVESDASIRCGSLEVTTNEALLRAARDAEPDAYIIYKPHPDVVAGQRDQGKWQGDFTSLADHVEVEIAMAQLLEQVNEVHTMTSLTGFEALLRGKKVTTYGMPFYAGWGLTRDMMTCERRKRRHSLESLVYFTLINYPTYVDPLTRRLCSAEQAIERVRQMKCGSVEVKETKLRLLLMLKRVKHIAKC
ncbi:capsular polysaccharide biosynthesis protein [Vibrio panuliri]|uniref:capsular polysaccharide biosynthesis protein n=1 Tax=Vibrio panuliri TaxID=1381081 RepID=UPI001CE33923|nr:capsular polysaccharide biosynthesis protein [Vibrio panuliri]